MRAAFIEAARMPARCAVLSLALMLASCRPAYEFGEVEGKVDRYQQVESERKEAEPRGPEPASPLCPSHLGAPAVVVLVSGQRSEKSADSATARLNGGQERQSDGARSGFHRVQRSKHLALALLVGGRQALGAAGDLDGIGVDDSDAFQEFTKAQFEAVVEAPDNRSVAMILFARGVEVEYLVHFGPPFPSIISRRL